MICLDEMGPESAKSFPGPRWVRLPVEDAQPAARAKQEIDYGRRGKGYVFGAFAPATGAALTCCYRRRTAANWVAFLEQVYGWIPAATENLYAILDNLGTHRASDVLLFSLSHPRWEARLSTDLRGLLEPDRAVVESAALFGAQGAALRDVGRD